MIGIILLWVFMGSACYSIYSMWTPARASNLLGVFGSGTVGGVLTLVINGYTHIESVLMDAVYLRGDYGVYTFAIGFFAVLAVMIYNGITTQGQTLVR